MISSAYFTNLASISCGMLMGDPVAMLSKAEKCFIKTITIIHIILSFFEYFSPNTFCRILLMKYVLIIKSFA